MSFIRPGRAPIVVQVESGGGQPEAPTSGLTTFTVTSATAGQQPFTVGHAFKQGDIPSGSTLTGLQCTIKNTWPDGSVKFAVLSGYATLTSNVARTVGCQIGTAPSGSALTTTNLKAQLTQPVTIDAGAFGSASWSGTDWDSPLQTWVSASLMSSWIYRKQIGSDAHLSAFLEVRLYSSGAVEVFPWVENGYITSTSLVAKSATYTVTIGGTQRFSNAISVKPLTRVPLLPNNGTTYAYWLGADSTTTTKHDRAYAMASGLVPNYIGLDPSGTVLDSLFKTYVINDATAGGQISTTMSDAGGRGSAFESGAAMYLKSNGDVRGYNAMMANALSSGAWSSHHRDPATFLPIRFSDYPSVQVDGGQGTPTVAHETALSGLNGTTSFTHLPSYGYGPYIFTGRYWFLEEMLFWVTSNYVYTQVSKKQGALNIIDPNNGYFDRGAGWAMTALWHAVAMIPSDHACYADMLASLEANLAHYRNKYVEGNTFSGAWVNPMGWFAVSTQYNTGGETSTNDRRAAPWQDAYLKLTLGLARNAGLPLSPSAQLDLLAVTNKGYGSVAQRAGDGAGSNPNWRHLTVFEYAISNPWGSTPPGGWLTAAQTYASWLSWNSVSTISGAAGLSIKDSGGSTDLNSGSGSIVYFDVYHDTLAIAAEHGASGAPEGFALVQGASNYTSLRDNYMKGGNHPWGWAGIGPRSSLPFTLPGPGQAVQINTNSFYDVKPSGLANGQWDYPIFGSYGGHSFNPDYSTLGAFVAGCAGGHSHPDYIGALVFDVSTRAWARLDPANSGALPYRTNLSPYAGGDTNGAPWWELNGMTEVPCPGHNYGQRNWLPRAWGGGPKGSLLVGPRTGVTTDGQQSAPVLHKFDLSTLLWSRASAATTLRAQSDSDLVLDVRRKRYWVMTKNDDTFTTIQYVDGESPRALNSLTIPAAISGSGYRSMFRGYMLTINAAGLYLLDPDLLPSSSTGWIALTYTGALPSFPGGRMVECRGKLYYRSSSSTNNVIHRITPPSNLKTGTWVIDTVSLNISLPAVATGLPHHAQLMSVPALDLLLWVTAAGVYLIQPE